MGSVPQVCAAGIVRPGRGVGAPALGPVVRVVGRDVAARLEARWAARAPADHVPLDDHGAGRVADPLAVVRRARLPGRLAGARVDGDDVRVGGQVVEVLAVQGEVPRAVAELPVLADVVRLLPLVVPDQVAGGGVERLQVVVARLGDVHHAVVDQRPDLLRPLLHRAHPGEPELSDVVAVDLIQRAEGLEVVGAVRHQPVGGIRVAEHLVRDRHEFLFLPGRGQLGLQAGFGRRRLPESHSSTTTMPAHAGVSDFSMAFAPFGSVDPSELAARRSPLRRTAGAPRHDAVLRRDAHHRNRSRARGRRTRCTDGCGGLS